MSYSSITKKQTLSKDEDVYLEEEDKHIAEYKEQQLYTQKNNNYNNYKKSNYKKYNEDAYNMTVNMTSNNNTSGSEHSSMLIIQPRTINIYNKKYCIKWLTIYIDTNFYHYDYCVKLFEMLMKWVRYNNFILKTNEQPLLGKFISLMYLLSNKKKYGYELIM